MPKHNRERLSAPEALTLILVLSALAWGSVAIAVQLLIEVW